MQHVHLSRSAAWISFCVLECAKQQTLYLTKLFCPNIALPDEIMSQKFEALFREIQTYLKNNVPNKTPPPKWFQSNPFGGCIFATPNIGAVGERFCTNSFCGCSAVALGQGAVPRAQPRPPPVHCYVHTIVGDK